MIGDVVTIVSACRDASSLLFTCSVAKLDKAENMLRCSHINCAKALREMCALPLT